MSRFSPSLLSTLILISLSLLFFRFGWWQVERVAEKQELIRTHETAAVSSSLPASAEFGKFTRLELDGTYDTERYLLLDNQVFNGRAGVHVLSALRIAGEDQLLLVNRGWLPLAPDRSLPTVSTPTTGVALSGYLAPIYRPGKRLGPPDDLSGSDWPKLVIWPEMADIENALGQGLYPEVLYLDNIAAHGFDSRDWKPVTMGPGKHKAYALQWFALSLTALICWIVLGALRAREKA